jgi:peptide/nickel transport system permease protein
MARTLAAPLSTDAPPVVEAARPKRSRRANRWRRRVLNVGSLMTIAVVVIGLFGPLVVQHGYDDQDLMRSLMPPFWESGGSPDFPLGTDFLGRDLLTRLVYGARTSLLIGVAAVCVAGALGTILGLISGYFPGWADETIMRVADMQLAFPAVILAVAIMTTVGSSLFSIVAVLGFIGWVSYARVIRGLTLSLREREFVLAAKVLGAGNDRLLFRHILPNIMQAVLALAMVNISTMILAEASLSFLGIGIRPPTPAWGSMLSEGRDVFRIAWWNAVFPGLAIVFTVMGINLAGDAFAARD